MIEEDIVCLDTENYYFLRFFIKLGQMIAALTQLQTQLIPAKFLFLLVICLTTPGLLAATQTVTVAGDTNSQMEAEAALHLVCVKEAQHFVCQPQKPIQPGDALEQSQRNTGIIKVTATVVPQLLSPAQQELISDVLLGLTYLLPIGAGLGIFMYSKYASYRSTFLKRQVETLERIWQQSHQH